MPTTCTGCTAVASVREVVGPGVRTRTRAGPQEWELLLRLGGAVLGTPVSEVDVAALDDLYVAGMIATMCSAAGQRR